MRQLTAPTILFLLIAVSLRVHAASTDTLRDSEEVETPYSSSESEGNGIIPKNALMVSTEAVTPVSAYPAHQAYDQARAVLAHAQELWAKGEAEAASDTALEAYDDLCSIRYFRGRKRKKLWQERHQAATIYVQAGIAFIRQFIENQGNSPSAIDEGRSRMEDLRDVAHDYVDLNSMLSQALQKLPPQRKS